MSDSERKVTFEVQTFAESEWHLVSTEESFTKARARAGNYVESLPGSKARIVRRILAPLLIVEFNQEMQKVEEVWIAHEH